MDPESDALFELMAEIVRGHARYYEAARPLCVWCGKPHQLPASDDPIVRALGQLCPACVEEQEAARKILQYP